MIARGMAETRRRRRTTAFLDERPPVLRTALLVVDSAMGLTRPHYEAEREGGLVGVSHNAKRAGFGWFTLPKIGLRSCIGIYKKQQVFAYQASDPKISPPTSLTKKSHMGPANRTGHLAGELYR